MLETRSIGESFQDGKAHNGTEDLCRERPAGLQAKIDVASIDKGTTADTDEDGAHGKVLALILAGVVEGSKWIFDEAVDFLGLFVDFNGGLEFLLVQVARFDVDTRGA